MLIQTLFVFLFGISVGSFLNVCIWRMPRGESIVSPGSRCPKCGHEIRWYENLPLFSWLMLRGRCSSCSEPISIRYFCVELLTGSLFLIAWGRLFELRVPDDYLFAAFVLYAATLMLMVATAFIDYDHRLIPNKITYPAIIFGIAWAAINPRFWHTASSFSALAFSCASASVFGISLAIFALAGEKIFKKTAFGWGDVKYVAAIAALLGPRAAFLTLLAGSVVAVAFGVSMAVIKKRSLKSYIPLGPFLAFGTLLWIARGPEIVSVYLRLAASLH